MDRRRRAALILYSTAAAAYAIDRITKVWAEHLLAGRPPVVVIPSVLQLRYTTNSGGAFSMSQSTPWLFAGASIVAAAVILATSFRHERTLVAVGLGLILAGALGNVTDRALRGPHLSGRVVDFIDFHVWPVFNVADSAIVIGAGLLLISSWVEARKGA